MLATFEPIDPPVTDDAHYFTLAELRAEQDVPEATYPDAAVEPNRDLAEQVLEHACDVAFIPRRRSEVVNANPNGLVHLSMPQGREVESIVDQYGTTWEGEQLADVVIGNGFIVGMRWTPGQIVTVTYTHGYETPPARVRRAAMIATRVWTERGPVDDRATQIAADGATINLATPGLLESVTGIPEVDATISLYNQSVLLT